MPGAARGASPAEAAAVRSTVKTKISLGNFIGKGDRARNTSPYIIRLPRSRESFQAGNSVLLLPLGLIDPARDLHPAQPAHVFSNPTIERFSNPLTVLCRAQALFISWIAYERNLRQDRRHIRADQHNERRLLHTTIAKTGIFGRKPAMQGPLHVGGKLAGFFHFLLQRNLLHQVLQFMDRLIRGGILARGYVQSFWRGGEIQVIGFHPACIRVMAGVGMDGHEQIRLLLIGDCSPRLERDESVIAAGVNHGGAEASLQQLARRPPYSTSSFSSRPCGPMVPVSCPPCPGSITILPIFNPRARINERSPLAVG